MKHLRTGISGKFHGLKLIVVYSTEIAVRLGNVLSGFLLMEMFSVKFVRAFGNYGNVFASVYSQVNLIDVLSAKAMLGWIAEQRNIPFLIFLKLTVEWFKFLVG